MTQLEQARANFDTAREAYRSALADELARLGGEPSPVPKRSAVPPPRILGKANRVKAEPVKKDRPAIPGSPYKGAAPGTETCSQCGRTKLFKAMGKGTKGLTKFHHAEKCGLPCTGGSLSPAKPEDLKAGKHEKGKCPKCDARVAYK